MSDAASNSDTYKVWTNAMSEEDFKSLFGFSPADGYFVNVEENSSVLWSLYETLMDTMSDDNLHYWSKSKINDWFVGRGFGSIEAEKETAWLTTVNHGFVISRTKSIIYYILK